MCSKYIVFTCLIAQVISHPTFDKVKPEQFKPPGKSGVVLSEKTFTDFFELQKVTNENISKEIDSLIMNLNTAVEIMSDRFHFTDLSDLDEHEAQKVREKLELIQNRTRTCVHEEFNNFNKDLVRNLKEGLKKYWVEMEDIVRKYGGASGEDCQMELDQKLGELHEEVAKEKEEVAMAFGNIVKDCKKQVMVDIFNVQVDEIPKEEDIES